MHHSHSGTYVLNASSCEECPSGYYAPTAQVDACLACGTGDHTKVTSKATTCSPCDGGTYSEGLAVNCSKCDAGKASSTRASECYVCDKGKRSDDGASSCSSCAAGTYSGAAGSTRCSNCTKGTYSSSEGSSACEVCNEGYFSSDVGSTSCLKCSTEIGTQYTSSKGSASCSTCLEDSYMSLKGECKSKPDGVVRDESGTTLETMELEPGFFRFSAASTAVYECHHGKNCRGGKIKPNMTVTNSLCRDGSGRALCSICGEWESTCPLPNPSLPVTTTFHHLRIRLLLELREGMRTMFGPLSLAWSIDRVHHPADRYWRGGVRKGADQSVGVQEPIVATELWLQAN